MCGEPIKVPHTPGCTWLPLGYWADADGRWGICAYPESPNVEEQVVVGQAGGHAFARLHWEEALFAYRGQREYVPDTFDCDARRMSFMSPEDRRR